MSNVASLELSKELYELSGWDDTYFSWWLRLNADRLVNPFIDKSPEAWNNIEWQIVTAYDLGYLLRKLPNEATSKKHGGYHYLYLHHGKQDWYAYYGEIDTTELMASGDTPEDACAKLAIELLKQGVLESEHKTNTKASS